MQDSRHSIPEAPEDMGVFKILNVDVDVSVVNMILLRGSSNESPACMKSAI